MDSSCQKHGFQVTHLAKDCMAYRRRLAEEEKVTKRDPLIKDK
jgi:hypothetical protein